VWYDLEAFQLCDEAGRVHQVLLQEACMRWIPLGQVALRPLQNKRKILKGN
jgi:hypothetical protein